METYHGKAYQLGYYESARCSDCHGSHGILKSDNPASMTSQENLVSTCANCHVGANKRFSEYLSHATHKDDPRMNFAYIFMTTLLLGVFSFFGIHLLMWLPRSLKERLKKRKAAPKEEGEKYIKRFSKNQRITHIFVIDISSIMLRLCEICFARFSSLQFRSDPRDSLLGQCGGDGFADTTTSCTVREDSRQCRHDYV